MKSSVEAIYEDGVFRPLAALPLQEHALVRLQIETSEDTRTVAVDFERSEWLKQGEVALLKVWSNDEDDVYNALLTQ
jgi:predicted DNA-binding antitoxin AbrB/MazE fold protein